MMLTNMMYILLSGMLTPLTPFRGEPYIIQTPDILVVDVTGLPKKKIPNSVIGEHLVHNDGKISLGEYGSVTVAGLTIAKAQAAVVEHLKPFFKKNTALNVSLKLLESQSQYYYVIIRRSQGDEVIRRPLTGNESIVDAIGSIANVPDAAKRMIWLARKTPTGHQRLPVDSKGITQHGFTFTNYQIMSGDHLYLGIAVAPASR
jgi:polysaccharide biosynthesis/export protein